MPALDFDWIITEFDKNAQDYILGYSQPSLRDWSVVSNLTQD
jgi:hypothetical protein